MSLTVSEKGIVEDVLECVDVGLDAFGSTIKKVVYFRFETAYDLQRRDILRRPKAFHECLGNFFGKGAPLVEASIVAAIGRKFPFIKTDSDDTVATVLIEMRKQIPDLLRNWTEM
jgi:hypothetical protein